MRVLEVAVAIVVRHPTLLITRRRDDDRFAGHWEFPGGKREPGESLEHCLVRELLEEVGLRVEPVEALAAFEHAYPARTVRLYPFFCRDQDPSHPPAKLLGVAEARWIAPTDLPTYRFLPANGPLIAAVMAAWAGQAARR